MTIAIILSTVPDIVDVLPRLPSARSHGIASIEDSRRLYLNTVSVLFAYYNFPIEILAEHALFNSRMRCSRIGEIPHGLGYG